jgi:hypothetical protein
MNITPMTPTRVETDQYQQQSNSSASKRDWASIIAEWQQSGLSQVAFCRLHHIKPHIFSYYKGKLMKSKKKTNKMVPVQLSRRSQPNPSLSKPSYNLTLQNGAILSFSDNVDRSSLKDILELLGVCAC